MLEKKEMLKITMIIMVISLLFLLSGCFLGYVVSGEIIDDGGQPIADVQLKITGEAIETITVMTDQDGKWQVVDLEGKVLIEPSKEGYEFETLSKTVSEEKTNIIFSGKLVSVTASPISGTYQIPLAVNLKAPAGYDIYFEMGEDNVRVPDENSTLFVEPISIDDAFGKTIIVKARGLKNGEATEIFTGEYSFSGIDIASFKLKFEIDHPGYGTSVDFSPDSDYIVSSYQSGDRPIHIWDVNTGEIDRSWTETHNGSIHVIRWSPCGDYIATTNANESPNSDRGVRIIDSATGAIIQTVKDGEQSNSLEWSPDSKTIARNRARHLYKVDVATGINETFYSYPWQPINKNLNDFAWSPAGDYISVALVAESEEDHPGSINAPVSVSILDVNAKDEIMTIAEGKSAVSVDWHPVEDLIVIVFEDGTAGIWDITDGEKLLALADGNVNPRASKIVNFSPCGDFIAGGTSDGNIIIWYTNTGEIIRILDNDDEREIREISWSADKNKIVAINWDWLYLWTIN